MKKLAVFALFACFTLLPNQDSDQEQGQEHGIEDVAEIIKQGQQYLDEGFVPAVLSCAEAYAMLVLLHGPQIGSEEIGYSGRSTADLRASLLAQLENCQEHLCSFKNQFASIQPIHKHFFMQRTQPTDMINLLAERYRAFHEDAPKNMFPSMDSEARSKAQQIYHEVWDFRRLYEEADKELAPSRLRIVKNADAS